MTNGRLTELTAAVTAATQGRLTGLTASVPAGSGTTGRLTELTASVPPSLEVTAPDQTGITALTTVSITATPVGGTPDVWVFSSPGITFSGSGATQTFTAPGTRQGTVVPVLIHAEDTGASLEGETTVSITVLPHGEYRIDEAGDTVPVAWYWKS